MSTLLLTPVPERIKAGEVGIINIKVAGMGGSFRLAQLVDDINARYRHIESGEVPQLWITTMCDLPHHQFAVAKALFEVEEAREEWGYADRQCVGDSKVDVTHYFTTINELEQWLKGAADALSTIGFGD